MDDFGTGTELRTSLVRGQLEAVMQVKIGTRGTTHCIHSLIKEFQKILQEKEQKKKKACFALGEPMVELTTLSKCDPIALSI